jgi:hypothetical protein
MVIRVFISVGVSQKLERTLSDDVKPCVGSLLLGEPLEAYGVSQYGIRVNGKEADSSTELKAGDHIELLV